MHFIHLADCHIDGYRDTKLAHLGFENFIYVIDYALKKEVDFVIIAGDLFNTALPRVDALKQTTEQLKRLKDADIPVYIIPGSHDYSPHGKTMLDVLEIAELVTNVYKGKIVNNKLTLDFTIDPKTQTHITGVIGQKGMLDKQLYAQLDKEALEKDAPYKIFCFHTTLTELKPKEQEKSDSSSISFLPKGFDYYAGGHVHIRKRFSNAEYENIIYPGPTFPNSFSELEALGSGSFIENKDGAITHHEIPGKQVKSIHIDAKDKTISQVTQAIEDELKQVDDMIVLLRVAGELAEGKPSDIDFRNLLRLAYSNGAYCLLKNTSKLTSKQFVQQADIQDASIQEIETQTTQEHIGQIPLPQHDEQQIITALLKNLNLEQGDGEKKAIFEERVNEVASSIFKQS